MSEANGVTPAADSMHRALYEYWSQSQRPLAALGFTLPLLTIYEGGLLALGSKAARNGADVWLRRTLDALGLGNYFLLPILTIGILLAWHHLTRDRWRLSGITLSGMLVESAMLSVLLVVIGRVQGNLLDAWNAGLPPAAVDWTAFRAAALARIVGFFGAGIYEEALFRLILLSAMLGTLKLFRLQLAGRVIAAILASSAVFSAAHYVGAQGEPWQWFTFAFRFLAGAFFGVLFIYRGFGIAAGTHALYDILVGVV